MQKKKQFYILLGVLLVVSLAYRLIGHAKLEQTTLLFMGLPALLALMIVKFSDPPKSTYMAVFRAITLFLLLAAVLFGEGIVCVLVTAPIFYAVGAFVVFILGLVNKDRKDSEDEPLDSGMFALGILLVLVVSGLYGDIQEKPIQQISVSKIIPGELSLDRLDEPVHLMADLPQFFNLGFPKPTDIEGKGTAIGDFRKIAFQSTTKGEGILNLKIIERQANKIVFKAVADDTHIRHWMSWGTITVTLNHLPQGDTEVQWTSDFQCELGPAWYFVPIERYAVKLSTEHLVNVYFHE